MALFHSKIGDKEKRSMGPWKKSVTLNSMGFRDLEHSLKKKKGHFSDSNSWRFHDIWNIHLRTRKHISEKT